MSSIPIFDTLIFDLGDVLFTWAPETHSSITPAMMHRILRTTTWFDYERGHLSRMECYEQAAKNMGVPAEELASAFEAAQHTLTSSTSSGSLNLAFMRAHAKQHVSYTSNGQTIEENFTQLLILEATGDPSLVYYVEYDGLFNFFRGQGQLTTIEYPYDSDTSAIGVLVATHLSLSSKHRILDDILRLRNADGIVQLYFDPSRPRVDPVICTNILAAFHTHGRGDELNETFEWVLRVLEHRAYIEGTGYYPPPEAFL